MKLARLPTCVLLALAFGCIPDMGKPLAPTGRTLTVAPGESIQAAVDAASPGDTVEVMPGDYTETHSGTAAVRITKPLKLVADSQPPGVRVRILPNKGQKNGIVVEPEADGDPDVDGVEVSGFTVEGFSNNGIWLRHATDFTIQGNEAIDNWENGIWPTLSAKGLVRDNVAYGSLDSALWVEASENVRVVDNDISHSPTGIEITVSKEITLEGNDVHDNTIGIGLYHPQTAGLPPLQPLSDNAYWHIVDNHVHDNNQPSGAPESTESASLPLGGGILLLGVSHVDLRNNRIENNVFFGIGMLDYCLATAGTDFDCSKKPPSVDPDTAPDSNSFLSNVLANNGKNPPPGPFQQSAGDFIVLGGSNNCASGNTPAPLGLPECY